MSPVMPPSVRKVNFDYHSLVFSFLSKKKPFKKLFANNINKLFFNFLRYVYCIYYLQSL